MFVYSSDPALQFENDAALVLSSLASIIIIAHWLGCLPTTAAADFGARALAGVIGIFVGNIGDVYRMDDSTSEVNGQEAAGSPAHSNAISAPKVNTSASVFDGSIPIPGSWQAGDVARPPIRRILRRTVYPDDVELTPQYPDDDDAADMAMPPSTAPPAPIVKKGKGKAVRFELSDEPKPAPAPIPVVDAAATSRRAAEAMKKMKEQSQSASPAPSSVPVTAPPALDHLRSSTTSQSVYAGECTTTWNIFAYRDPCLASHHRIEQAIRGYELMVAAGLPDFATVPNLWCQYCGHCASPQQSASTSAPALVRIPMMPSPAPAEMSAFGGNPSGLGYGSQMPSGGNIGPSPPQLVGTPAPAHGGMPTMPPPAAAGMPAAGTNSGQPSNSGKIPYSGQPASSPPQAAGVQAPVLGGANHILFSKSIEDGRLQITQWMTEIHTQVASFIAKYGGRYRRQSFWDSLKTDNQFDTFLDDARQKIVWIYQWALMPNLAGNRDARDITKLANGRLKECQLLGTEWDVTQEFFYYGKKMMSGKGMKATEASFGRAETLFRV